MAENTVAGKEPVVEAAVLACTDRAAFHSCIGSVEDAADAVEPAKGNGIVGMKSEDKILLIQMQVMGCSHRSCTFRCYRTKQPRK